MLTPAEFLQFEFIPIFRFSLEGAMGVMYMLGLGTRKDHDSAFVCLREAAERGNVYAMGNLVAYYYRHKLYTKAVQLAGRYVGRCSAGLNI